MGKQEGMGNVLKRRCHEVWLQDKMDQKHFVNIWCSFVILVVTLFFE